MVLFYHRRSFFSYRFTGSAFSKEELFYVSNYIYENDTIV